MLLVRFLVRRSLTLLVCSLAAGVICGISSVLVLVFLNRLVTGGASRHSAAVIGAYVALVVVVTLGKFVSFALLARLVQSAVHDLRVKLAEVIVQAPLRTIEEKGTAELFAMLTDDVTAVANGLAASPLLLINAAIVAGCGVYLAWLSWPMALGLFVTVLVWVGGYILPMRFAFRKIKLARSEQGRLMECYHGLIDGNKELKLSRARRDSFLEREFQPTAARVRDMNVRAMEVMAGGVGWGQSLSLVMIGMALFAFGAASTASGQSAVVAVLFLIGPFEGLVLQAPTQARSRIALDRLYALTATLKPEPTNKGTTSREPKRAASDTTTATSDLPTWRSLQLVDLSYAYQSNDADSVFRVGPLDFSLSPGEVVFVVGGNGSGKSTFFKLLAGLYPPDSGEIRWDGQLVTPTTLDRYRELFAAVFADFFLFHTLTNTTDAAIAQAEHYLSRLHLQEKVSIRDGRFSTLSLSQGQRQRLALVAAYLENRPIYLFDEWAASQDPTFRRVFYRELLPEFQARGKTVLVISHDEEYYDVADRLVKLHDGRIESDRMLKR